MQNKNSSNHTTPNQMGSIALNKLELIVRKCKAPIIYNDERATAKKVSVFIKQFREVYSLRIAIIINPLNLLIV